MPKLRAAFYGDDFTGSTDALMQFSRFGLRSLLLFDVPARESLAELAGQYDVVGVAGISRSLSPDDLEAEVRPALETLRTAGPELVQYKMCSTADSSPHLGSLGRAIEVGREVFGAHPVPVLAAQPEFGRYTAFANHFAVDKSVDAQTIFRLDRQPTMSRHPATPMTEADLRLHIGKQTTLPIASLDLTAYGLTADGARRHYEEALASEPGAVIVDAVTQDQLAPAADLLLNARRSRTLYALGSGGLSYGVGQLWCPEVTPMAADNADSLSPADRLVVVSGSCSARTSEQIRWVLDRGWAGVRLEVDPVHGIDTTEPALRKLRDEVLTALTGAPGVVVYSALEEAPGTASNPLASLGIALGHVAKSALDDGVRRVVVAGGDTSGQVMRAINADAAEVDTVLGVVAVICRLRSGDPAVDGAQVLLKGGQAGSVDLFERVRRGDG